MVPKYPFRVEIVIRDVSGRQRVEVHNYENLVGAMHQRENAIRHKNTKVVRVLMVLHETDRGGGSETG